MRPIFFSSALLAVAACTSRPEMQTELFASDQLDLAVERKTQDADDQGTLHLAFYDTAETEGLPLRRLVNVDPPLTRLRVLMIYDHEQTPATVCGKYHSQEIPFGQRSKTCWSKDDIASVVVQYRPHRPGVGALAITAFPLGVIGVAGLVVKDTVGGGIE